MAPNREACELLKTELELELKMYEAMQAIREKIKKLTKLLMQIKYRIISVGDFLAADLLSAVKAMAATAVDSLLGSASDLMKKLLEQLIRQLVTVFLSAPEFVYALIAFPLEGARQSTNRERMMLIQAQEHYNTINQIVAKWLSKDIGRGSYYTQMRNALLYVQKASMDIGKMIAEIDGSEGYEQTNGARNAYFNEGRFKSIQNNILAASAITMPQSNINQKLGISQAITEAQAADKTKRISEINQKYDQKKKENNAERSVAILKIQNKTTVNTTLDSNTPLALLDTNMNVNTRNLVIDLQRKKIDEKWASKNQQIETERQTAISAASIAASVAFDPKQIRKAIRGNLRSLKEEFKEDMELLAVSARQYLRKIVRAYLHNKASQLMCNSCYNIRDLVARLIQELIQITRNVGNASSKTVLFGLNTAYAMLVVVEEKFTEDTKKYKDGDTISSARMASDITVGHGLLVSSSAMLNATVTESLIKLINADDDLFNRDREMVLFMGALERIPDWEDNKKIWAVEPLKSGLNPYVQLLADSTKASLMLALYMGMGRIGSRKAKKLTNDINNKFRTVKKHNEIVLSTLYTYEPLIGSEITEMMNLLKVNGLFAAFAAAMSIGALVRNIISMSASDEGTATEYIDAITYVNCKNAYPELFSDPKYDDLAKGEKIKRLETNPPKGITESERDQLENTEVTRNAMVSKQETTDYFSSDPDDF